MVTRLSPLALALVTLLVSCGPPSMDGKTAVAPHKRDKPLDLQFVGACTDAESKLPLLPTWQGIVLPKDVETWNSGACTPLEVALHPLETVDDLGRKALREECAEKASTVGADVRAACRAVCAAKRWIDGRELGRQRTTSGLMWFRDHLDQTFDDIEACKGVHHPHGNQLGDGDVRALWSCAHLEAPPAEMKSLLQYWTEPVHWKENGSEVQSARPIDVQWLRVESSDVNLPYSAVATRCVRGQALERVMSIAP